MKTRGFRFERHVRNPLGARVLARIYLGPRTSKGEGMKRKQFEAGTNPCKRKRNVCVYMCERERKSIRARGEKLCERRTKRVCERAASGPSAGEVVALHKRFPTLCGGFGYGSVQATLRITRQLALCNNVSHMAHLVKLCGRPPWNEGRMERGR